MRRNLNYCIAVILLVALSLLLPDPAVPGEEGKSKNARAYFKEGYLHNKREEFDQAIDEDRFALVIALRNVSNSLVRLLRNHRRRMFSIEKDPRRV